MRARVLALTVLATAVFASSAWSDWDPGDDYKWLQTPRANEYGVSVNATPGYGEYYVLVACVVALSLIGVVMWGSIAGCMLPFLLRALWCDPASASAPFVATLVDVTGLVIYFSVATFFLRGTLL